MAPPFWTFVVLSILAVKLVFAGSRTWESSIAYTPRNYVELNGNFFGRENSTLVDRATGSAHTIKKRYVTINPGNGNSDDRLWPDGKIQYCFESAATKELFFEDLVQARKLWELAGLGAGFDWVEKNEAYCKDNNNRPNFLLIVESDGLSCTTGVPPLNKLSTDPENRGPLMRLTASLEIGKLNTVANYAHEMGHAWGLHHEHQNPNWWSSDYAAANGNIFGASNFRCENLVDYAKVRQSFVTEEANGGPSAAEQMEKACTSRSFAKFHRFSAAEYLPFVDSTMYRASKTATEPDWDSIMIYGSGSGGSGSGNNRASILTKPNGDKIKENLAPSQQDVEGLKNLYSISPSSKFDPLGSKSNVKKNTFNDIRKKERDSGCGEVPPDDPSGEVLCSPSTCGGGSCPLKRSRAASPRNLSPDSKRAVPTTSDPTWGFLNKPTTGGLDAFATEFFNSNPTLVDLSDDGDLNEDSTSIFVPFGKTALFAGITGLYGCTSVILTSRCATYMTHHWESHFKGKITAEAFEEAVLIPLTIGNPLNDKMQGISQLPQGCFTEANNLQATIFTPSFRAGTSIKYAARVALIINNVATQLGISETSIRTQLYDTSVETQDDLNTASGKVLLTYNPSIFKDGTNAAAYQVWAGATLANGILIANDKINAPMQDMQDLWTPTSKKRDLWSFIKTFSIRG